MRLQDVEAILRALNDAEVRYLIVGGLAVIAHGYPRLTVDVDLVVNLERGNVLRAMNTLEQIGYRPLLPVATTDFANEETRKAWQEEQHMIVFQMQHPDAQGTRIDLFVDEPFNFDQEYERAEWLELSGVRCPVLRIEALIALKEGAGRPKDVGDIGELKKLLDIRRNERSKS
jgi:predicted nucleotidyltransferase